MFHVEHFTLRGVNMVRKQITKKLKEYFLYAGVSQYKHEYMICIGISNRVMEEREGERSFASIVGFGLPLGTESRKEAQTIEKSILEHILDVDWICRAYPKHHKQRGKDWVMIKPSELGNRSFADLIIIVTEYAREQAELFATRN